MGYFQWDDKLDTGVDNMNDEHKFLIDLMNKLHDVHTSDAKTSVIGKAFDDLANYTIKHFKDEEEYMASINYPDLLIHQGVHKSLLDKVMEFKDKFKKEGKLHDDFFPFLKMWLVSHIKGIDVKYGQYSKLPH